MKQLIPIFFACNDAYVPYLDVAITSLQAHANKSTDYSITVLKTDITEENQKKLKTHESDNLKISFFDVQDILKPIEKTLPDMFYYTLAAYYRLFIESMFPQFKKILYLDCDIVVLGDVSKLWEIDLKDNMLAGVVEGFIASTKEFREYAQKAVGVNPDRYINSGILSINLEKFRENKIEENKTEEQKND